MATISLQQYPNCPHLCGVAGARFCAKLSAEVGEMCRVSTTKCNRICEVGQAFNDPGRAKQLIHTAFTSHCMQQMNADFLNRIMYTYSQPYAVRVPDFWPDLKKVLAPIVAFDFVRGFALSGSSIYGELPSKDIDVIVYVNDWEKAKESYAAFRDAMPTTALGKPLDIWVRSKPSVFFAELDCDNRVLNAPFYFNMADREVADGITVNLEADATKADIAIDAVHRWHGFKTELGKVSRRKYAEAPPTPSKNENVAKSDGGCGCGRNKATADYVVRDDGSRGEVVRQVRERSGSRS